MLHYANIYFLNSLNEEPVTASSLNSLKNNLVSGQTTENHEDRLRHVLGK